MRLPTALVVQHSAAEDAGRLADWLEAAGLLLDVHRPYDGSPLPSGLDGHAALIVLGGSMGAHDDEVAPWLPATRSLLATAVAAGVPTLGVCLGAQLLAVATGGWVERGGAGPEIGPGLVAKRDAAGADPLFGPVPFTPDVVHWHWDVVTRLPPGAVLLASSTRYPHQAFRIGAHAWAVQFHLETTPEMLRRWAAEDAAALAAEGIDVDALLARTDLDALHADLAETWRPFASRFAELVRGTDRAHPTAPADRPAPGSAPTGGAPAAPAPTPGPAAREPAAPAPATADSPTGHLAAPDRAALDRAALDRAALNRAAPDRAAPGPTAAEPAAPASATADSATGHPAAPDHAAPDRPGQEPAAPASATADFATGRLAPRGSAAGG